MTAARGIDFDCFVDHFGLRDRIRCRTAVLSVSPMAEIQAEWVADLVGGRAGLPSYDEKRAPITSYDAKLGRRYVVSKRHTIEVDFHDYDVGIEKERKAGRRRARTA